MIAAIYARRSQEQNGLADEARSVARQIDNARAYATRKGWTVSARTSTATTGSVARNSRRVPAICGS